MTKRTLVWIVLTVDRPPCCGRCILERVWNSQDHSHGDGAARTTRPASPERIQRRDVDQANVKLADNRIALRIEAQGSALGAPYAVVASANGAPRYDAARGELFFDADSVRIESVTLRGTPLLGGENNPDTLRGRIEAAAHSVVEIGIKTFLAERPVYRFRDNLKGMVLNAAITNIAIAGNTLVIGVSLWNVTAIVLAFLLVVLLALWLIVVLIRHPMWGPGKAVG